MRAKRPILERIWEKVDRSGGPDACWPWRTYTSEVFHPRIWMDGGMKFVSRIIYGVLIGPIPPEMYVLHRCDFPLCCNPAHFFLGTTQDNTADRVAKNRSAMGERNGQAKLSNAEAVEIKKLISCEKLTLQAIADRFNTTKCNISMIKRGVSRKIC